ncbi:hypothetical protein LMG33818_000323 [Halomonadaceae bacterium LMG 33818]
MARKARLTLGLAFFIFRIAQVSHFSGRVTSLLRTFLKYIPHAYFSGFPPKWFLCSLAIGMVCAACLVLRIELLFLSFY